MRAALQIVAVGQVSLKSGNSVHGSEQYPPGHADGVVVSLMQ
jgi:hypothetical protein